MPYAATTECAVSRLAPEAVAPRAIPNRFYSCSKERFAHSFTRKNTKTQTHTDNSQTHFIFTRRKVRDSIIQLVNPYRRTSLNGPATLRVL